MTGSAKPYTREEANRHSGMLSENDRARLLATVDRVAELEKRLEESTRKATIDELKEMVLGLEAVIDDERKESTGLRLKLAASEAACAAMREALVCAADAISNDAGWHDENADENGDDTCESGEPCGCRLPTLVNSALSSSAGRR